MAGCFVAPSYQVGFNPLLQTDDNESFQTINTPNPPKRQLFASSLFGGLFYSSAFQKLSSYSIRKNVGDFLKNVGDFSKNVGDFFKNYCCLVKVFLMIKIRLKPSCRISASFVTLLVGKKTSNPNSG